MSRWIRTLSLMQNSCRMHLRFLASVADCNWFVCECWWHTNWWQRKLEESCHGWMQVELGLLTRFAWWWQDLHAIELLKVLYQRVCQTRHDL
jgi:hypothetical protein